MSLYKSSYFSLVEFLVVGATISMITSLLSPSIQRIYQNAHQVTCKNNLKQLSISLHFYADDHNNLFPPIHGTVFGSNKNDWNEILSILDLYPASDPSTFCPTPSQPQSYGLNTTPINGGMPGRMNRPIHRELLENPSQKLQGGDCTDILTYRQRSDPSQSLGWLKYGEKSFRSLAYRHDNRAMVFFFDGRVEAYELAAFNNYLDDFNYSRNAVLPAPDINNR